MGRKFVFYAPRFCTCKTALVYIPACFMHHISQIPKRRILISTQLHAVTSRFQTPSAPTSSADTPHMPSETAHLLQEITIALDAKKAEDIRHIHLAGKSVLADAFVIATGTSDRHVAALAQAAADIFRHYGLQVRFEGLTDGQWVVVDAGDIILHLFQEDTRNLYKLDDMWCANLPDTLTNSSDAA